MWCRAYKKPDGTLCVNDQEKADFLMITLEVIGLTMIVLIQSPPLECLLIPLSMTSPSLVSAAGLNKIKPEFYKRLASILSSPLASMFNTFLEADFVAP